MVTVVPERLECISWTPFECTVEESTLKQHNPMQVDYEVSLTLFSGTYSKERADRIVAWTDDLKKVNDTKAF